MQNGSRGPAPTGMRHSPAGDARSGTAPSRRCRFRGACRVRGGPPSRGRRPHGRAASRGAALPGGAALAGWRLRAGAAFAGCGGTAASWAGRRSMAPIWHARDRDAGRSIAMPHCCSSRTPDGPLLFLLTVQIRQLAARTDAKRFLVGQERVKRSSGTPVHAGTTRGAADSSFQAGDAAAKEAVQVAA
jgi:hypothetical protein